MSRSLLNCYSPIKSLIRGVTPDKEKCDVPHTPSNCRSCPRTGNPLRDAAQYQARFPQGSRLAANEQQAASSSDAQLYISSLPVAQSEVFAVWNFKDTAQNLASRLHHSNRVQVALRQFRVCWRQMAVLGARTHATPEFCDKGRNEHPSAALRLTKSFICTNYMSSCGPYVGRMNAPPSLRVCSHWSPHVTRFLSSTGIRLPWIPIVAG